MYEIAVSSRSTHESNLTIDATTLSLVILYSHGVLLDCSHQTDQAIPENVHAVNSLVNTSVSSQEEPGIP